MNFDSRVPNVTNTTGITNKFTIGYDEGFYNLWYLIAFFVRLVIFFLIVCGEFMIIKTLGKSIHENHPVDQHDQNGSDALPPPYHLYKPLTYNKTVEENSLLSSVPCSNKKTNLYIVPVHASAASGPTAAADVKMCATV